MSSKPRINVIRIEILASPSNRADRLDTLLAKSNDLISLGLSRTQIQTLIECGHVAISNVAGIQSLATKPSLKMDYPASIFVTIPEPKSMSLLPLNLDLNIVYEDESLAVIDKPAGISIHPSTTDNNPTLVHGLLFALKNLSSVGGTQRPGIVHRIDKGTSGLVVISKTDLAHIDLSRQFKEHSIERKYLALVRGEMGQPGKQGRIETFFGRHPVQRKKMTGRLDASQAKRKAITYWQISQSFRSFTFVECRLETGRTHQIRVHLSELGFPIVGDTLYGRSQQKDPALLAEVTHQLLHAAVLGFTHPTTKKQMRFDSDLPPDFKECIKFLQKY